MAIKCPKCGAKHDVAVFEAEKKLRCRCGYKLDLSLIDTVEDFLRYSESEEERQKAKEIQQDAQAICRMILDEASPKIDVQIARGNLKEKVQRLFPDKLETYEMIYEARFKRLWEQFRPDDPILD